MSDAQPPESEPAREPHRTSNIDHSPTVDAPRGGRRGSSLGLRAVVAGLLVGGLGIVLTGVSVPAAGVLIPLGVLLVLGGCFAVARAGAATGPSSGGGFSGLSGLS